MRRTKSAAPPPATAKKTSGAKTGNPARPPSKKTEPARTVSAKATTNGRGVTPAKAAKPLPKPVKKAAAKAPAKAAPKVAPKAPVKAAQKPAPKPAPKATAKAAPPPARPMAKAAAVKVAPKRVAAPEPPRPIAKPHPVASHKTPSLADAIKAFESAVKVFQKGNFAAAREGFEKVVQRYPNQTEILARVAMYVKICNLRLEAPARQPQTADSLYDRGVLEMNRANYEAAIELFKRALKAQPESSHFLYALAAAQVRSGKVEEGFKNLERACEIREIHRSHARNDPDFASLRGDIRFQDLAGFGYLS